MRHLDIYSKHVVISLQMDELDAAARRKHATFIFTRLFTYFTVEDMQVWHLLARLKARRGFAYPAEWNAADDVRSEWSSNIQMCFASPLPMAFV